MEILKKRSDRRNVEALLLVKANPSLIEKD
nr:MAG TPA: hypothetical protein [Caudoviricetes sp.]